MVCGYPCGGFFPAVKYHIIIRLYGYIPFFLPYRDNTVKIFYLSKRPVRVLLVTIDKFLMETGVCIIIGTFNRNFPLFLLILSINGMKQTVRAVVQITVQIFLAPYCVWVLTRFRKLSRKISNCDRISTTECLSISRSCTWLAAFTVQP